MNKLLDMLVMIGVVRNTSAIYREEVRKYPNCAQLKEALIGVINFECELQGAFPDPALYREMANLTEDIIALGGGKHGLSYHRHQLVYYSEKLKNRVRAAEIAETAPEIFRSTRLRFFGKYPFLLSLSRRRIVLP